MTWHKVKTKQGEAYYTTDQAEGAIPNGTAIVKVQSEHGDANPIGTKGVVLGSMSASGATGYFIEWDSLPGVPVFVGDFKIAKA